MFQHFILYPFDDEFSFRFTVELSVMLCFQNTIRIQSSLSPSSSFQVSRIKFVNMTETDFEYIFALDGVTSSCHYLRIMLLLLKNRSQDNVTTIHSVNNPMQVYDMIGLFQLCFSSIVAVSDILRKIV